MSQTKVVECRRVGRSARGSRPTVPGCVGPRSGNTKYRSTLGTVQVLAGTVHRIIVHRHVRPVAESKVWHGNIAHNNNNALLISWHSRPGSSALEA